DAAAGGAPDQVPDDPYRGQYLTPAAAQRILDAPSAFFPAPVNGPDGPAALNGRFAATPPPGTRVGRLARDFRLTPLDVELLLIALAPDIDARFERLYGYLHDDLTRRRPTIGLALELCGLPAAGAGRFRFAPSAPLVDGGLLAVREEERPLLSRPLAVPDRVVAHLLGDREPDARLYGRAAVGRALGDGGEETVRRVAAAIRTGGGLVHLLDRGGDGGRVAVEALALTGHRPLVVDIAAVVVGPYPAELPGALALEARLGGGGTVLGPLDALDPGQPDGARLLRELCLAAAGTPLIVYGAMEWDPRWAPLSPVPLALPRPTAAQRARQWRRALTAAAPARGALGAPDRADPVDPAVRADPAGLAELAAGYRLDAPQI
ncbi:ATP-binding protein, partial [Streptomyces sp. NPDC057638]